MKKLSKFLQGLGLIMFLLTGCIDTYDGSTFKFLIIISLWLVISIGLILLGDYLDNFILIVKKTEK